METKPLNITMQKVGEGFAYDIEITDASVTLGDYIRLFDEFLREKVADCFGCDACCHQRVPLILPDIYLYCGNDKDKLAAFLDEKAEIHKNGPAYDIKLVQLPDTSCVYLDDERCCCKDHLHRSFACHAYVCLPQTNRSRTLRETIINEGEDALIGAFFAAGILPKGEDKAGYPVNPVWQGKSYDEIRIKDIIPADLWESLQGPWQEPVDPIE